jgi:hypothetical protein
VELEFVASHFGDFLLRPKAFPALPFSFLYEIISHGSLRIESEDGLYDFIRKGTKMNLEMFYLLEFVRFEYCSTDVMDNFFDLLWDGRAVPSVGEEGEGKEHLVVGQRQRSGD